MKSGNIWQGYKKEGGCLVHFVRLATTLLKKKKVHDTIHLFAYNYAKCLSILKISSLTDSATKPCLIWLLTIPPHLKYVTTVPCNLSLITTLVGDCRSFSDVSVSQGSVATHSRYGEIFDK